MINWVPFNKDNKDLVTLNRDAEKIPYDLWVKWIVLINAQGDFTIGGGCRVTGCIWDEDHKMFRDVVGKPIEEMIPGGYKRISHYTRVNSPEE